MIDDVEDLLEYDVHEGMVGERTELDLDRTRREKYGDFRVSIVKGGIYLLNEDKYAKFGLGGKLNEPVGEVFQQLCDEERTLRESIREAYSRRMQDTGPELDKRIPAARLGIFTDKDGYLGQPASGMEDLARDFFSAYMGGSDSPTLRMEMLEDLPQFIERHGTREEAVRQMAKSYPQAASTVDQYIQQVE